MRNYTRRTRLGVEISKDAYQGPLFGPGAARKSGRTGDATVIDVGVAVKRPVSASTRRIATLFES